MSVRSITEWTCNGCGDVATTEAFAEPKEDERVVVGFSLSPKTGPKGWVRQAKGLVEEGDYCPGCREAVNSVLAKRKHRTSEAQYVKS